MNRKKYRKRQLFKRYIKGALQISTVIDYSSKCKKLKKHYVSKRKNDLERYKYSWYKLGGKNEKF